MLKRSPKPDTTAASRRRAYKLRQKNGRISLRIDVDDTALPAMLIELGFLPRGLEDDKKSLQDATSRVLDALAHGLIQWR
jgi:hypothetical protein